jgi:Nucleoside-diphosphate-sugar pyrophosphorylase involved in lipopolysaccharide biosynthesis/translation initiation factor 2B, gamma/epsilon subunits (eIF-2Bgamma/eIF-2Bepsilon)
MKAMILAAGLGTRLRPLTNDRPKALVEIAGRTLLEITLERLRTFGIHEVIINVHHFADKVVDYLRAHRDFGMRIVISREDVLLDTGGGLKKAAWFFLENPETSDEPFLLHNVDVMSTIDLRRMAEVHAQENAISTLAVQNRRTSRYLLFESSMTLCGRRSGEMESWNWFVRHRTLRRAPSQESMSSLRSFCRCSARKVHSRSLPHTCAWQRRANPFMPSQPMITTGGIWESLRTSRRPRKTSRAESWGNANDSQRYRAGTTRRIQRRN